MEVKCNHGQVHCGLLARFGPLLVRHVDKELHDVGLDWELLLCWRVNLAVPVQHDLETREKAFRANCLYRVGITGQSDRLANGCKRATDCAIFDLVSFTIVSCADSGCKP